MYELRTQAELKAFYRFAIKTPGVWGALKNQRLEHTKLGFGTVVEFVPGPGKACEPILSVRFDSPTRATTATGLAYLLLPYVFRRGKLRHLSVPTEMIAPFRAFMEQERWKEDKHRFEEVLQRYRIERLYHFTELSNMESILKHGGLYSWWRCTQMGIRVSAPGSDSGSRERDRAKGLQDYLRLSFSPETPMLYTAQKERRIRVPKILLIDTSVVCRKSTRFSSINTNDREARDGEDFDTFGQIRFDFATSTNRWCGEAEKRFRQAEALVKGHIPLDLIKNLKPT